MLRIFKELSEENDICEKFITKFTPLYNDQITKPQKPNPTFFFTNTWDHQK